MSSTVGTTPAPDMARMTAQLQLLVAQPKAQAVAQATEAKVLTGVPSGDVLEAFVAAPEEKVGLPALPAQRMVAASNFTEFETDILQLVDMAGQTESAKKEGEAFNWRSLTAVAEHGAQAQQASAAVADTLIHNIKMKDGGTAAKALGELFNTVDGFDRNIQSYASTINNLLHRATDPIEVTIRNFLTSQTAIEKKLDDYVKNLSNEQAEALADAASTEQLRGAAVKAILAFQYEIAVGIYAIRHVQDEVIPALKQKTGNKQDEQTKLDLRDADAFVTRMTDHITEIAKIAHVHAGRLRCFDTYRDQMLGTYQQIAEARSLLVPLWKSMIAESILAYRQAQRQAGVDHGLATTNRLIEEGAKGFEATVIAQGQSRAKGIDINVIDAADKRIINGLKLAKDFAANRAEVSRQVQAHLRGLDADLNASDAR